MDGLSFTLVKSPEATLNDGVIELHDENRCIVQLQVCIGGKPSNSFEVEYSEDCPWVAPRRDYVVSDGIGLSNLTLYIDGNPTKEERFYGFSVISNMGGECVNMAVHQPACKYILEVDKAEVTFEGNAMEEEIIEVSVGGASKTALVSDDYLDIVVDDEIYDYDNCLSYTMSLDKANSTAELNKYILKIKCLGRFMDTEEGYYVKFPIIHKSNPEVFVNIKLNIGLVGGSDAVDNFDEEYNKQDGTITTVRERNEENKRNAMLNVEIMKGDNAGETAALLLNMEYAEGIEIKGIQGNKITLQTNVYNGNGEIEHDSMIALLPNAAWCHATSEYKEENHYVTVSCDENYWKVDRTTRMLIRNAEVIASSKAFLVIQKADGSVEVAEYISIVD